MSKDCVTITTDNPISLTMHRPDANKERIGIRNEYPQTKLATTIFQSLGLMYLVSPYLPEKITTDFFVPITFQNLIGAMYESEGYDDPTFLLTDPRLAKTREPYLAIDGSDNSRAILTYSGGKDTLWNLDWLVRELGISNILATHFNRINPTVAAEELRATLRQQEYIGFPLHIVDLLNSSKNHGKSIMRARDMFLVGVTAPLAVNFGASRIVLEGGFWTEGTPDGEPFTTYQSSWIYFNRTISELGIPTQAYWRDSNGMNAIEDLAHNRPEWLRLVYNCFSPGNHKPERRRKWQRVAPTFPLYETQCGSCVKCRELNIARIAFDPQVQEATPADVKTYISDTIRWTDEHKVDLADLLAGAFLEQLTTLAETYGLKMK